MKSDSTRKLAALFLSTCLILTLMPAWAFATPEEEVSLDSASESAGVDTPAPPEEGAINEGDTTTPVEDTSENDSSATSGKPRGDEAADTTTETPDVLSLLAEEATAPLAEEVEPLAETSGYCGDPSVNNGENVTWSLDDAGTLTISGSGAMGHFTDGVSAFSAPWLFGNRNNPDIKTIIIQNGVTSIGNGAFAYCTGLTSITIPNSVTSIGLGGFAFCTSLTSITIPNSVLSIGMAGFNGCQGLTSITLPNSITVIEAYVFTSCTKLTNISIPDTVTTIGERAFANSILGKITIPSNVTSIGASAFSGCAYFSSITFEGSAPPTIAQDAFFQVSTRGTVHYPEGADGEYSLTWLNGIAGISSWVLAPASTYSGYCGDPAVNNGEDVSWQFDPATGLLTISGNGAVADFSNMENQPWAPHRIGIQAVTIEEDVTSIGAYSFSGCLELTKVFLSDGVTAINKNAFLFCMNLVDITLPNSVRSIGENVFFNCYALTSIIIPGSVTTIGNLAFFGSSNLTSVAFEGTTRPPVIAQYAFGGIATSGTVYHPEGAEAVYTPEWLSSIYGISSWTLLLDTTPPVLAEVSSERTGKETATVTFQSNEKGVYYYGVVVEGEAEPTIETRSGGVLLAAETDVTLSLAGMTDYAARDVWILVKDPAGNIGKLQLTIAAYQPIDASINPATATFDTYASSMDYHDVSVTLSPGDYALVSLRCGSSTLVPDTDYTVSDNTYTIKKEYLATFDASELAIIFAMDGGVNPVLTLTVTDTTPPIIFPVLAHFDAFEGSGTSTATIDANRENFLYLEKDGELVDQSQYTLTSGSTIITLTEDHLKTLGNGEHTYLAVFSNGYAELQLLVNVAAPQPQAPAGSSAQSSSQAHGSGAIPHTGDSYTALVLIALATFVLGILCIMAVRRRMKERC